MLATARPNPAHEPCATGGTAAPVARIDSKTLFGDRQLLLIDHAGVTYTLRTTRNGKLLLTK